MAMTAFDVFLVDHFKISEIVFKTHFLNYVDQKKDVKHSGKL
jgi:hypothetical protein